MAKIMIVDDEPDVVFVFKLHLEMEGHSVTAVASDGAEAVDMYRSMQFKPDLILMDYRMPRMNGLDATREILAMDPSAKIIFVSADFAAREAALRLGAVAFFDKPVSLESISRTIDQILADNKNGVGTTLA